MRAWMGVPLVAALLGLAAGALVAAATDAPEGDEETSACGAAACDDGGPFGFGVLSVAFTFGAVLVAYDTKGRGS